MAELPGPPHTPPQPPLFLGREVYRRNRIADAARLLPVLGAILLLFPDLILSDEHAAKGATAPWLVYFFAAWMFLIGLAFLLARKMSAVQMQGGADDVPRAD